MRLGGIQPVYLPWLGYFDQLRRVDLFVIADEMPYSSHWYHRNRVRGPNGAHWLTLPISARHGDPINSVRLNGERPWSRKHLKTLRHFYARGVELQPILAELEPLLDQSQDRLVGITIPVIKWMAQLLGIHTPIIVSSERGLEEFYRKRFPQQPSPTHRIIAYMEALGADSLLEGESGQSYFDIDLFHAQGMRVDFHRYEHPVYPQLYQPFYSHLSTLDLLLSVGATQAREIFLQSGLRDVA